jgi:hypothetical protein
MNRVQADQGCCAEFVQVSPEADVSAESKPETVGFREPRSCPKGFCRMVAIHGLVQPCLSARHRHPGLPGLALPHQIAGQWLVGEKRGDL